MWLVPRRSLPLGRWLQLLARLGWRLGSQLGWPLGRLRQLLLDLLQRLQGSQTQTQWLQLQWLQPFLRHWFEQLSLVFHRPEAYLAGLALEELAVD